MAKFYLTTPIYYASGAPHIGHAFATIYADIIARYHRLKGDPTFFLVGTDEHGSKIAEKAHELGQTPQEFVDSIAAQYQKLWTALNIESDIFIRTTSDKHKSGVKKFFEKLRDTGALYEGSYEGFYCTGCEDFITESKLINGLCPDHQRAPEKIREKNYFFNLKKYLLAVREKIISGEFRIAPETRKNEILNIIDSGIPDFSITRDRQRVSWGIPYFYDESQTIYVWGDALINYVTALDFPDGELYKKFWPADVHIVGSEINKFHSIYWPAMLLAAGVPLPRGVFVHGLFTINGQKMSKTIGNIIDPMALIPTYGVDGTRYLLVSQFPASEHGDIRAEEFTAKYNSDLANGFGNLLARTYTMIRNSGLRGSDTLGDIVNIDKEIQGLLRKGQEQYDRHFANYELFDALQTVFHAIKRLDRYINETEPWKLNAATDKEKLSEILETLRIGAEQVTKWLSPFLPEKCAAAQQFAAGLKTGSLPQDAKLNLFPRI